MKLLVRWIIGAIAIGDATWLIPGIRIEGNSGLLWA
jgi:hypothetical protein